MKIDIILSSCTPDLKYIRNFANIKLMWENITGGKFILVLISKTLPEQLINYKENVILFDPILNISNSYVSQVIRILYPALFQDSNVFITDMDIIPIRKDYFVKPIADFDNETFITWTTRYTKQNMFAICYNIANNKVWKNIFGIENVDDVKNKLVDWYNIQYTGKKNCEGWYTDQIKLYEFVIKYEKLVILNDNDTKFKRLDKKQQAYITKNLSNVFQDISNEIYTDYHFIKREKVHDSIVKKIFEKK